jgi:hypothetical protein
MGSQLYSIAAILVSTAFLLAGNGLMSTLTPLRANLEGFSHLAIGAMGSFYYAGFVAGCLAGPRVLAQVGHIRTFAVAAALAAATVLLQYSLSIAHATDRMLRSELVEASATLLLIDALASVIGPILAAVPSLFLYTAAVHLAMTVFTVVRTFSMRAVPGTAREHYVTVPPQASPGAIELDPRGPEHNAREVA